MLGLALSIMGSFAGQENGTRYSFHKTLVESRHVWGVLTSSRFCIFNMTVSFDVDLRGYAIRFGKFLWVVVLRLGSCPYEAFEVRSGHI